MSNPKQTIVAHFRGGPLDGKQEVVSDSFYVVVPIKERGGLFGQFIYGRGIEILGQSGHFIYEPATPKH